MISTRLLEAKKSVMESGFVQVDWRYEEAEAAVGRTRDMCGAGSIPVLRNSAEATTFAFLDVLLEQAKTDEERIAITIAAWNALQTVNAKYIMVMQPGTPIHAVPKVGVNTDLATNVGLFYAEWKESDAKDNGQLALEVVNPANDEDCVAASAFQTKTLPWFRKLNPEVNNEKTETRYKYEAFCERVKSEGIYVYTFKDKHKIVATITLNLYRVDNLTKPSDHRVGYLSDLFVEKGWHDKAGFMKDFMTSVFNRAKKDFPAVTLSWGMAATNNTTIPIAQCFDAVKPELLKPLTDEAQQRLGVCVRFQGGAPSENKHAGKYVSVVRQSLFHAAIVRHEKDNQTIAPSATTGLR
jgi:hypothetical protein